MPVPSTTDTDLLRDQLIRRIDGYDARMPFDDAVAAFPDDAINAFPPNVDYTPWHLLEHLRITQADILDFIVNGDYVGIEWPTEYWPSRDATATLAEFIDTIASIKRDQATLRATTRIVRPTCSRRSGHARTHDLREVRVVGDQNAYHIGEFAVLRQVMGTWPADHML